MNPIARAVESADALLWYRRLHDVKFLEWLRDTMDYAGIGRAVKAGAKKKRERRNEFVDLLERIFIGLAAKGSEPTAAEVIDKLMFYDLSLNGGVEIIQEILEDKEIVYWKNWRGHDKKTTFGTIRNHLTKIRKRHRK